ncbi:MAG: hypothetical protein ACRDFQ_03105 [Anaerolineales bacterium]
MPDSKVLLVLCLTGLIGLGVPAMLYAGLRRGDTGQFEMIKRARSVARKPWKTEDDQLSELSRRVEALRKK